MKDMMRRVLCKFKHRFFAWESTIQKLEVDTVLGNFTGYMWQEMCSRCFKIQWTAGRKRPFRIGAHLLAIPYEEHLKKIVNNLVR